MRGSMKIILVSFLWLFLIIVPCFARDFQVDVVEENYRETLVEFSNEPLIYQSFQVNSSVGPKLLILSGEDYNYRKWLRHYISQDKKFIIKISDENIDEFITAKAYEIDIKAVHPFNGDKWTDNGISALGSTMEGDNHILVVDPDERRIQLVQSIVEKMSYQADVFNDASSALEVFKLQPQKFKLVIIHFDTIGMSPDRFVEQVVKFNPSIPVLLDTGYNNESTANSLTKKFSGYGSIHIKPVILRDLQKTIEMLIKKNA
jgi:CheY-like chemotaxis protein